MIVRETSSVWKRNVVDEVRKTISLKGADSSKSPQLKKKQTNKQTNKKKSRLTDGNLRNKDERENIRIGKRTVGL